MECRIGCSRAWASSARLARPLRGPTKNISAVSGDLGRGEIGSTLVHPPAEGGTLLEQISARQSRLANCGREEAQSSLHGGEHGAAASVRLHLPWLFVSDCALGLGPDREPPYLRCSTDSPDEYTSSVTPVYNAPTAPRLLLPACSALLHEWRGQQDGGHGYETEIQRPQSRLR